MKIYFVRVVSEAYVRAASEEEAREIARDLYNGNVADAVRPPQTVIGVWDRHALDGRNEKP
jgi:hypothetical protein